MDYEKELNPEQLKAVKTTEGPVLILAGAGSGKTRVISYRITYLIEEIGVDPRNILAITFTNKAAREMRERVEQLLNADVGAMWISTFHSFCGRILRSHADLCGLSNNFVIYDDDDTTKVIRDALKKLNLDADKFSPQLMKSHISDAKNRLIGPEQYAKELRSTDFIERKVADVYKVYQSSLAENNAMDFDDMIMHVVNIFEKNPDVLDYYSNRFKYVMVDEYQDTNNAQYKLVSMLARHGNLCVVGDDDQSIYAFRGADVTNILNFEKEFKNCLVIKLEQNYRSTQTILSAANKVIENNKTRKDKKLWTKAGDGEKVTYYTGDTQNTESMYVCNIIKQGVESGKFKYSDYTVLYRMNSLSQNLETTFMRMKIPYVVYGGQKFMERKEIKDLLAYLKLISNPDDTVSLRRIINVPRRGIGDTSINTAMEIAAREEIPLMAVLATASEYPRLSRAAAEMMKFAEMITEISSEMDDMSVSDFVEYVLQESGILTDYLPESGDDPKTKEEKKNRHDNLKEFISVAKEYEADAEESPDKEASFIDFLQTVDLSTDMDLNSNDETEKVRMMTIHSSKGLEFPNVFVVGMEEGLFPSYRSINDNEVDEERRLCYVAITRARTNLYLTNCRQRLQFGKTTYNAVSRFMSEIPDDLINRVEAAGSSYAGSSYGREYGESRFGGNYGNSRGYSSGYSGGIGYGSQRGASYQKGSVKVSKYIPEPKTTPTFGRSVNSAVDVAKLAEQKMNATAGTPVNEFKVGDNVMHAKFGEGVITKLETSGADIIAEINFGGVMKRLMLNVARLKKL